MTKEQVLDVYPDVCESLQERLKLKYPQYFNNQLKEGEIYKFENVIFQICNNQFNGYYIDDFSYINRDTYAEHYTLSNSQACKIVEDESLIETYFKAEAKRRGYVNGIKYNYLDCIETVRHADKFIVYGFKSRVFGVTDGYGGSVFYDGKWMEIVNYK